jgi:hypothetical protein
MLIKTSIDFFVNCEDGRVLFSTRYLFLALSGIDVMKYRNASRRERKAVPTHRFHEGLVSQ